MSAAAKSVAKQIGDSRPLELLARAGLTAYGIIHLLVGWLALLMAWGGSTAESTDLSGALRTLAEQPFGKIMLWLVAGSLGALALWQVSESIWGYRKREDAKRKQVASGTKAVVYAALGVSAARFALGSGSSSSVQQQEATSGLLTLPAGRVIVVAAGMLIVGVGVAHVTKGVRKSFLKEIVTSSMSPNARQGVTRLAQIGYIAKGVAIGGVGGLLTYATVTFDPQMQGLDGALQTLLAQPSGKFLLTVVALGFVPSACSQCSSRATAGCSPLSAEATISAGLANNATGRTRQRSAHSVAAVGRIRQRNRQHLGGAMSTTGWIILIVVLLIVFGGFGFSRRGR